MDENITRADLERFAHLLGARIEKPADVFLVGGAALLFLGSGRATEDVDYVGNDLSDNENILQRHIDDLARETKLNIEAVAFSFFVPALSDSAARHRLIGRFGLIQLWVFDPVAIALSKLDRGFETDLQDVTFLLATNIIELDQVRLSLLEISPLAHNLA